MLIVYGMDTLNTPGPSSEKFSLRRPEANASTGLCTCPGPVIAAVACAWPDNVSGEAAVFAYVAPALASVETGDVQLATDITSLSLVWSGINADQLRFVVGSEKVTVGVDPSMREPTLVADSSREKLMLPKQSRVG
jgi:hypothetical protein